MKHMKRFMGLLLVFVLVLSTAMPVSAASSVSLNKTKATLYLGESETLKVSGAKGKVSWSTSNKKVVTVSSKGKITAKKEGKATIKAKVSGKTLSCKVTVKKEGLSSTKLTLGVGQSETLKLRGKGTIKAVKSSKTSVATVTKKGKITAKKTGKAKITITSSSGKKYTCTVTVKKASLSSSKVTVAKGDYTDVSLNYATLKSVKSSNTKVAKAAKKSGKIRITAVKKGSAKITVKDARGKKYTCSVNVEEPSISAATLALKVGETSQLKLNGNSQKIAWTSSNASVASVDASGNVTGLAAGSATITAKVGRKSFKCNVTVTPVPKQYTVTFNTNGGSSVASQTVKEGELATKPANPTKARSVFAEWYTDSGLTTAYNFNTPVNSNITLYAKWNMVRYSVTFNTNGGSEITQQQVYIGERAYKPMDPTKRGYVFDGWYTNSGLTAAYDFTTPMTGNITLYAKWAPIDVRINLTPDTQETNVVNRTVTGTITANIAISSISYELEGENNQITGEIPLQDAAGFELPVLLENGNNTLKVTVTTIEGSDTPGSVTMEYDSGHVYNVSDEGIIVKPVEGSETEEPGEEQEPVETPEEEGAVATSEGKASDELSDELPVDEERVEMSSILDSTDPDNTTSATGVSYVSNVFDLYFNSSVSFSERETFVGSIGGEVAGYLNALDMMQVKFTEKLPALYDGMEDISLENATLDDIKAYADDLAEQYSDYLESVDIELVYDMPSEEAVATNDPWNGTSSKYWLEMIEAEEAWNYDDLNNLDFLTDISLGIVDAGFDTGHEDLAGRIRVLSSEDSAHDHGTHVAGIIAAIADNGKGIAGIMHNNANIRAYDAQPANSRGMSTSQIMAGLTQTVEAGAKAVNFSLGSSSNVSGTELGLIGNIQAYFEGGSYSKTMGKLLERGFDFVVVQSAGNGNSAGRGIDYKYNGVFCSISRNNCYSSSRVTREDIINRILVVAAVDSEKNMTFFSNGGTGDLNIVAAPGSGVYSCVTSEGGKYGSMSGTSMAAPVVTATCGLTWSMNPALTGAEVVNLVMTNTSGTAATNEIAYTEGGMGIVNAKRAVQEAYERRTTYYGSVVDAVDGDDGVAATITIRKADGTAVAGTISTESYSGYFELPKLPAGSYKLEISAEEYATKTVNLRVEETTEEEHNIGKIAMSTGLDENQYRIILRWGEYPYDLDSHLVANLESGSSYHVYYSNKRPSPSYANLDWDDTSSYGPETITITNMEGLYDIKYAVHDYSNKSSSSSTELSNSGANVEVWKGDTLMYTFYVPTNAGGTEWDVFAFDAGGNIVPINTMTYCETPGNVLGAYQSSVYGMQLRGTQRAGSLEELLKQDEAAKENSNQ